MSTPAPPPPGAVPGFVARLARRAHGVQLRSVASSFTFVAVGFVAINLKNVFFAGLSLQESLLASLPTLLVKGGIGYFYPAVRDPILERVPPGFKRLVAESVAYAILQTTSFALVVAFLIPLDRLPKAIFWTFVTSVFMGKLVGIIIDLLTRQLVRLRSYIRESLI